MNESPRFLHTVIRASAGTGKTYQLSSRYIGLLAAGVAPEQILATTFTRKAAGEILDRVLLRLAQAASDEAACRQLAGAIDDTQFTRARARQLLAATSRNLHRLRVGTLDSYFLQVAGGFALELGLPAGWSICDELLDQTLREDAIEEVLARGKLPELRTLVHLLAKGEAVRSVSSVIQATVRSVYATYRQSEPPAWQQIPQPKGLEEQELAATIDQLAAYPLPGAQWTKARDADVQNALLGNWEALIDKGIAGKVLAGEANYNRKPIPDDLVALYERLLAHVASVLVGQLARQTQATRQLLERFAEHYAAAQAEQRALRFDDVTHYLAAATAFNSPRQQAYRLDGLIRHLLLDEFQDTAPTQWRVLRPLAQSLIGQEDASFFSVGDTKQAIYGWRGGVAEIFDALDGELPGLAHESLAHSYRSSQPVIDAVNRAFQYLTRHPNLDKLEPAVAQWQAKFPAHSTARSELPGHVRLEFAPLTDEGVPQADAVFEYAADQVAQHVRRASQCSVGVLVRTNAAVARMIYLLRQRDVPASEEGGNPLTDSPAVELVLSLLRLADHPGDSAARFHLAWSPLAEALELADHTDARAASKLARSIRRRLLDEGYGVVVFDWAKRLAPHCDRRDQSRLQQLVELAYEYQPASTLRTRDFLALAESKKIADPSSADVRVMTIHQAKGLEFDIVVLPELDKRLVGQPDSLVTGRAGPTQPIEVVCRYTNENVRRFLPQPLQALFDDEVRREVAEAMCVLYVAMTRAVHCLHMILTPPKANEKSLPKTFAGLLRASLAESEQRPTAGIVFEHGDAAWFERLPARTVCNAPPCDELPATIRLAPPLAQRDRGLERTSPSALEGGSRFNLARLLERNRFALEQGTLVHAWLERLAWLDDGSPDDAALRAVAARLAPDLAANTAALGERLDTFRKQLAHKPIAAVLRRSFYDDPQQLGLADAAAIGWQAGEVQLQVQSERTFALRDGDEILVGSIDRLVLVRRGGRLIAADIIDFKTDELPPRDAAALADKVAFYQPQIEAYRKAAARLLRLDPRRIAARLVFLGAGKVCPVPAAQ